MLADIDERKGREVADAIVRQGGTAAFTRVDAADEQSVIEAIVADRREVYPAAGPCEHGWRRRPRQ